LGSCFNDCDVDPRAISTSQISQQRLTMPSSRAVTAVMVSGRRTRRFVGDIQAVRARVIKER